MRERRPERRAELEITTIFDPHKRNAHIVVCATYSVRIGFYLYITYNVVYGAPFDFIGFAYALMR